MHIMRYILWMRVGKHFIHLYLQKLVKKRSYSCEKRILKSTRRSYPEKKQFVRIIPPGYTRGWN